LSVHCESFAIAGLLSSDNARNVSQLPWIGSVPVLGALSQQRVDNDAEARAIETPALDEAALAAAIAAAARGIAETLDLAAIISWTSSGSTGLRVARERPESPIVAISPKIATGRRLSLIWGIHCIVAEDAHDLDDMVERACRLAFKDGFAKAGQRVIIVAGVPLGTPGATNMLRIAFVGSETAD
jgi:pyruvate kinase